MKIIIISKSYYPNQSARAMRATELAQQLARMGHNVIVYTVIGLSNYKEYTEQTGVKVELISTKWMSSTTPQSSMKSFLIKGLSVLFGRFMEFPNIEFVFKVPEILEQEKDVDLLITVALPYPIHWGAAFAKKKMKEQFPKTWVSDCGDPYMGNDVFTPYFYFQYLEKFWGKMTDYVTIPIKEAAKAYYENVQEKIRVIPQGFDFTKTKIDENFTGNDIPTFAYTGTIFQGYRDLTTFLDYLCTIDTDFRFYVYTRTKDTVLPYKEKLKNKLIISDYIPRQELIYKLSRTDFLINLTNQSVVQSPSKLIDYGLSGRPILDISTPFVEKESFEAFMKKDYSGKHLEFDIQQYNIEVIAKQFLALAQNDK